jgi:hypothetical protein
MVRPAISGANTVTKRRNTRYTKRTETSDPYTNLVTDIIIDAILMVSGQSPAKNDKVLCEAILWLQSETCQRWSLIAGIDIRAAMEHKDSLVRLEGDNDR